MSPAPCCYASCSFWYASSRIYCSASYCESISSCVYWESSLSGFSSYGSELAGGEENMNDLLFPRFAEAELEPATSPIRSTRHMSQVKDRLRSKLLTPDPFTSNGA